MQRLLVDSLIPAGTSGFSYTKMAPLKACCCCVPCNANWNMTFFFFLEHFNNIYYLWFVSFIIIQFAWILWMTLYRVIARFTYEWIAVSPIRKKVGIYPMAPLKKGHIGGSTDSDRDMHNWVIWIWDNSKMSLAILWWRGTALVVVPNGNGQSPPWNESH